MQESGSPVESVNAKPIEMDRYTRMTRMKGKRKGAKADFGQANLRPEICLLNLKYAGEQG